MKRKRSTPHPRAERQEEELMTEAPERPDWPDDREAFIKDPQGGPARAPDDLAEELAEVFVMSATSGEDAGEEVANAEVPEETGGPFVVTTGRTELAHDTDASNPPDAEVEPFPKATRTR